MITVHMIGNAHLDPVWLWRWQAGVGEAIATCRSAADRIDEYKDFIFTRSDMWVYEQIEKLDPNLFERIRKYVESGRWQIVGGWYIQPDCNLPTAESFRKHISLGKAYFKDKFGVDVTVGYNVDSFGHNAMIPSFLQNAGYDSYVMMRPMAHEKELPSALFRWRSPDNSEVLVWRIPRAYTASQEDLSEHIKASIDVADPEIGHVMCFYGVGDHGGGPTKRQIEWIIKNQDAIPNAKLIFSHPRAFFDAVKPFKSKLPIVDEELQYHSIGCYTVVHEIKKQMRQAEHRLISAEKVIGKFPNDAPENAVQQIDNAWKKTLFNQFHDIYAGTSLASAYDDARDQLGSAKDTADVIINNTIFRRLGRLPDDQCQRIYVFNPSDRDFNGCIQHDPWLNWGAFEGYLVDESGDKVLCQRVQHESVTRDEQRIIWKAKIPAGSERIYQLSTGTEKPVLKSDLKCDENSISNSFWRVICAENGSHLIQIQNMADNSSLFKPERLEIISQYDHSDTWSHSIKSFNERVAGKFRAKRVVIEETGPIQASIRIDAKYKESSLSIWARLYSSDPRLELKIWVNWNQHLQVLKLNMPFISNVKGRLDGVPGGFVKRLQNGQEYPIMDWTLVEMEDKNSIGIVCPDCFGLDGIGNTLRFTLLRSPVYAWHDPRKLNDKDFYRWTDQGEHEFRFILMANAKPELLQNLAISEHRPPLCYDWTKGMK